MKHANTSHIGITPKRKPRTDVIANMAAVAAEKSARGAAASRRRAKKPAPMVAYETGYFTALIRRHNWPPMYEPHLTDAEVTKAAQDKVRSKISTAAAEAGKGHAGRDMGLPGSLRIGGVKTLGAAA